MARKRIDLTGQRFGRLVVLGYSGHKKGQVIWECICDCGNTHLVPTTSLRGGRTRSCGCLNHQQKEQYRTHGESKTKLYHVYHAMLQRCYDTKFKFYHHYGGRGIRVCPEWQHYEPFRDWALSNGYEDGLSIEREDVNGNYTPDNCKWIPMSEQANNKRRTVHVEWDGETVTLRDLADQYGLERMILYCRIVKMGWSIEDAINRPVAKKKSRPRCARPRAAKEKYTLASL